MTTFAREHRYPGFVWLGSRGQNWVARDQVPESLLRLHDEALAALDFDPDNLKALEKRGMSFAEHKAAEAVKAWRDIWGAGQSAGAIFDILPAADVIARMRAEYLHAKELLCAKERPLAQP